MLETRCVVMAILVALPLIFWARAKYFLEEIVIGLGPDRQNISPPIDPSRTQNQPAAGQPRLLVVLEGHWQPNLQHQQLLGTFGPKVSGPFSTDQAQRREKGRWSQVP
jgi:hypothetical protein